MTPALWFLAVSWLVFWCGYDWGVRRQAKRIEMLEEALRATQVRTETHADVPEISHRLWTETGHAFRVPLQSNRSEARN